MESIKDWVELVYYIAFIILTVMLVWYAKKTYVLEASKTSRLLCKVYADQSHSLCSDQPFMLEIYNFGNDIAQNITVDLFGHKAATLDFLKPGESTFLAVGFISKMRSGHRAFLEVGNSTIELHQDEKLSVHLKYADYDVELGISLDSLFLGTGIVDSTNSDIAAALKDIKRTLSAALKGESMVDDGSSIQKRLDKISDAIAGRR